MDKVREIPSALMLQWEQEAMEQKVSLHGLKDFIRMKERLYWQSVEEKKERPQIFANAARNKLTEYGNSYVLDYFLQIPIVERTCKLARFDMEDLQKKLSNGFVSEEQKENFLFEREHWFMHLKERMKDLRISKETMESYGLSWKSAKSFAYQTI